MANKKKPTMMEMKTVINNILITLSQQNQNIQQLDAALSSYIDYKGDKENWIASVNKDKGNNNGQDGTKS